MEYHGRFPIFDSSRIRTYPLAERLSKVTSDHVTAIQKLAASPVRFSSPELIAVSQAVLAAHRAGRPVILMTGAHAIKNGFGPLMRNLLERGLITLLGLNAAGTIHDLELALTGRTSEDVAAALPRGEFGFARETGALINEALAHGHALGLGYGEALGRLILGEPMPRAVHFPHAELSVLAGGLRAGRPVTVHVGIGTDVIDQHPGWDGAAKGGCSGRDFLIFAAEVERMQAAANAAAGASASAAAGAAAGADAGNEGDGVVGGVYLNIGSSVTGPEVFLKACSMAANVGHPPTGLVSASFDIRPAQPGDVGDERKAGYYFRDIKSVVVRIPESFGGKGYYIQGDHLQTIPALYQHLVHSLNETVA